MTTKNLTKATLCGALLAVILMQAGCVVSTASDDSSKNDRISSLEDDLNKTKAKLSDTESKRDEAEKQKQRMINCNRDFRGSYGVLVNRKITLTRETGRVIRKNCAGTVVSDGKETLKDPKDIIDLPELSFLKSAPGEIIVLNRQTCETGGFWRGIKILKDPLLRVNRSSTLFDHEVFEGLNQIDFGICDKDGKTDGVSKDCANPTWVATLNLDVASPETEKNEITEVNEDNCAEKAKAAAAATPTAAAPATPAAPKTP